MFVSKAGATSEPADLVDKLSDMTVSINAQTVITWGIFQLPELVTAPLFSAHTACSLLNLEAEVPECPGLRHWADFRLRVSESPPQGEAVSHSEAVACELGQSSVPQLKIQRSVVSDPEGPRPGHASGLRAS